MALNVPALRFEAEAFRLGKDKILGRQSAGDAFLRAIMALPDLSEIAGHGPSPATARSFASTIAAMRRDVSARWIAYGDSDGLKRAGGVHFPDPMLGEPARMRMSAGPTAWSITGITHTISSMGVMRGLADFAFAPLMEWDALILTSDAVKASVLELLDEQDDYAAWRFPGASRPSRPNLPVIPLGVHGDDFAFSENERTEARRVLGLGNGDVAFLFVGRLSFHAKANPLPMYWALEEAAKRTGKRIALIQCGWFANAAIESAFKQGAERHAPSVRHLWVDGRETAQRSRAWAAGDVFISLSDNIQETFGLTPLEAMAAGLPVLVTDWNGYRQTVRHGETGFMIPTFAPASGTGGAYAADHACDAINYDHYIARTARHISIDLAKLFDAAEALTRDADLRRSMGKAGCRIAREHFDWKVLIGEYLTLWTELEHIRSASLDNPRFAPRIPADRLDPFRLFANYPTHAVSGSTRVRRRGDARPVQEMLAEPMLGQMREALPGDATFIQMMAHMPENIEIELKVIARNAELGIDQAIGMATVLLKAGIIEAT